MPLSWNEIKTRALAFSKEWENTEREEAEAKPFLIEFLNVFGIHRKRVATFEHKVKKLNEADGYIDLLWKGMLLVEMKSRGKDLDKAYQQAKDYCAGLKDYELPKLILISDFFHFHLYHEDGNKTVFTLPELIKNCQAFAPIAGYIKRTYQEQDPVNIAAAELMGKLHDRLKAIGYGGHQLELYLVRLLFCLFADDTSIFDKGIFYDYIELKTNEDGSDLAAHIAQVFQILNTHEDNRLTNIDEALAAFPYVNGKLFEEVLPVAGFDSSMREILLQSCRLDWGKISPAIFGSLFQSVMDEKARRNLGAHYTSEKNILKLIKPLFLDELWDEFRACKKDKNKLKKLHDKISKLRFLDPACGCGNFLIIAYRELRLLELEIVKLLLEGQQVTSINDYFLVDVDQFYGIEYEEFPSQIAQVAMWLMDHQMNELASLQFGDYFKRIPLKKSATIVCGNALRIDWQSLIVPYPWEKHAVSFDYIFGNPPFVGAMVMTKEQREDFKIVFEGKIKGYGILDYVSAWYLKASEYLQTYNMAKCGFVSTSSICQGEQVGILWSVLTNRFKIKINFAHRTFRWNNEAKGLAAVHCIIIGFSVIDIQPKRIFEYENINGEAHELASQNINSYLVDGKNIFLENRDEPICKVPKMAFGSMPRDGGHLIFLEEEKESFIHIEPSSIKWIRPYTGAQEYLNGYTRYCLWLVGIQPAELRSMPEVLKRVELVRKFRLESKASSTRKYADTPAIFCQIAQPNTDYLLIPRVSSERRKFIPVGFVSKETIANDQVMTVPNATLYHFGVINTSMHMSWVKYTCGRLESRFRYSKDVVYNNFPWPENPSEKQKAAVEAAAQQVLDVRLAFPGSSLADLYDPNAMPPALVKAHQQLDKAVDLCYRPQPFASETKRIEFLFELYDKYTAGLFVKEKKKAKK